MVYFDQIMHHSAGNDQFACHTFLLEPDTYYVHHRSCTLRSVDLSTFKKLKISMTYPCKTNTRIHTFIYFQRTITQLDNMSLVENRLFAYAKTKTQISFAVTAKLISAFVFATRIVQSLYFLNTKLQASSHLL